MVSPCIRNHCVTSNHSSESCQSVTIKNRKLVVTLACIFAAASEAAKLGYSSSNYHVDPDDKACVIHLKEIEKIAYVEEEKVECHTEPKEVCENHEKLICREIAHKKVCMSKPIKDCHVDHHEVCEKHVVKVPHPRKIKTAIKVCH